MVTLSRTYVPSPSLSGERPADRRREQFCWGGALGLTQASGEPLSSLGYDRNAAVRSVAMATPRSSSPLPPEVLEVASNIGRSNSPFHQGLARQPISGS